MSRALAPLGRRLLLQRGSKSHGLSGDCAKVNGRPKKASQERKTSDRSKKVILNMAFNFVNPDKRNKCGKCNF